MTDGYDWAKDSLGCYNEAVAAIRERGIRTGQFEPLTTDEHSISPRIVRDAKSGIIIVQSGHIHVHGYAHQLNAFAALLIRAAYEAPKGMHDGPPLPKSDWVPSD